MPKRPDPERLAVWQSLLDAHASVTARLARELEVDHDMPFIWYQVLGRLHAAGGQLRMSELARRATINKSSLSRIIDRLEDAGYVERAPSPDDARGQVAVLQRRGVEAWRAATPTYLRGVQREFASHLTESDVVALARVFAKVVAERDT